MGLHATSVALLLKRGTTRDLRTLSAVIRFLGYDPRPVPNTIGEALVRHRTGQGMSPKELAAKLSVDPTTLARWERGERQPGGKFLKRAQPVLEASCVRSHETCGR